eukprot:TRINITY_DN14061_c0_g1_i1.p1 TRINITY_DN14061_c0_g1~~TRINITY_DN14061_c0_g1_i1.p1  ORF type:complete len:184 (+),score=39.22 TRINITY_DN14061_c0_g1_i1:50-553(+)
MSGTPPGVDPYDGESWAGRAPGVSWVCGKARAGKGTAYLSQFRLVLVDGSSRHGPVSVDLHLLRKERLAQPIFAGPTLAATVVPDEEEGDVGERTLKVEFKEGGTGPFMNRFVQFMSVVSGRRKQMAALERLGAQDSTTDGYFDPSDPIKVRLVVPVPAAGGGRPDA